MTTGTGPTETGSAATGPAATGPAATGPAAPGPTETGSAATGPATAEPATTGPVVRFQEIPDLRSSYQQIAARTATAALRSRLPAPLRRTEPAMAPSTAGGEPARHVVRGVRFDADRLTAYQHHVGEPGIDLLPPGFVHVTTFGLAMSLLAREDFPLPAAGMVHVANRIEQFRPLLLGDSVDLSATTSPPRPHAKGLQLDVTVEATREGELVWRGVSAYLHRRGGTPSPPGPPTAAATPTAAEPSGPPTPTDPSGPPAPAERSGRLAPPALPTARWRFDAGHGRRYAAVSGDVNPIHLGAAPAKLFGFKRAIAHGMDTAARALALLGPRPDRFTWTAEFTAPVYLPSQVSVAVLDAGTVIVWDPRTGRQQLTTAIKP